MACVIVPIVQAVAVTLIKRRVAKKECAMQGQTCRSTQNGHKIPFSRQLNWLSTMLWGGSALLVFEHIWHGEIVPWFPFLTAMSNPTDTAAMWHEMMTVGASMSVAVTLAWLGMVFVTNTIGKRQASVSDLELGQKA